MPLTLGHEPGQGNLLDPAGQDSYTPSRSQQPLQYLHPILTTLTWLVALGWSVAFGLGLQQMGLISEGVGGVADFIAGALSGLLLHMGLLLAPRCLSSGRPGKATVLLFMLPSVLLFCLLAWETFEQLFGPRRLLAWHVMAAYLASAVVHLWVFWKVLRSPRHRAG